MRTSLPRIVGRAALAGVLAACLCVAARAQTSPKSYTVIDLGRLDGNMTGGFQGAGGNAINAAGKIVGWSYKDEIPVPGGALIAPLGVAFDPVGPTLTTPVQPFFPFPDYSSQLTGVNDAGEVIGIIQGAAVNFPPGTPNLRPYAFHPDATATPLALPDGATFGSPLRITNTNRILGRVGVPANVGNPRGFTTVLWSPDGTRTDIPALDGRLALDINDAGTVVGYYQAGNFSSPRIPFVWDAASGARDVPFTGSNAAYLLAIDSGGNLGGAVGASSTARATLWGPGGTGQTDIHPGFGDTSEVFDLTDSGLALVTARFSSGAFYDCLYDGKTTRTLISMVPESSPFVRIVARAIAADGRIVGQGFKTSSPNPFALPPSTAVLLIPSDQELPHPANVIGSLKVAVRRPRYDPATKRWAARVTLTNVSNAPIPGPLYVVADGITAYVAQFVTPKAVGQVTTGGPLLGRSYYQVDPAGGSLGKGRSAVLTLNYSLPAITFASDLSVPVVLAGSGRP
jgi:hypothetical protein